MNDLELPEGWAWSTVGEVGLVQLGRQRSPKNHAGDNMRQYLRVANVFEDRIDTSDVMSMNFTPEEYPRYRLEVGDILLNEGQSPELLGRPAMYRGNPPDICFTNSLIRFRAHEGIEPGWALLVFRHHMHSLRFMRESQITTNIAHLSAGRLKPVEFPIPPAAEQRRIVEAAEAAFSKLDAGVTYLDAIRRRLSALRSATVSRAVNGRLSAARDGVAEVVRGDLPTHWTVCKIGDLTVSQDYGTSAKTAAESSDDDVPVLRMGNIQKGRIDGASLKFLSAKHPDFPAKLLVPGDVLFNRTNSPELVGKTAVYKGEPRVAAFASYLIRVRLTEAVLPEWAALYINSREGRSYMASVRTQQVGQANVNGTKLAAMPIPVPPIAEQEEILEEVSRINSFIDVCERSIAAQLSRSSALRRSVLSAALSGRLAPQDPNDEAADVVLERLGGAARVDMRPAFSRAQVQPAMGVSR